MDSHAHRTPLQHVDMMAETSKKPIPMAIAIGKDSGSGHHSLVLKIILQARAMGYNGPIRVYASSEGYSDKDSVPTDQKLARILRVADFPGVRRQEERSNIRIRKIWGDWNC